MKALITKYKGKPILSIPTGKDYHFNIGQVKAKLIIEHLNELYEFIGVDKPKVTLPTKKQAKPSHKPSWEQGHCWYCSNGNDRQVLNEGLSLYYLCECGATECPLPNHRVSRNKLGGVRGISWKRN